jgi:hypothetical protein
MVACVHDLEDMVSRLLIGIWVAFDFLLLCAGIISLVLSNVWSAPDILMNMVLSRADLSGNKLNSPPYPGVSHTVSAGTILGVALLITFALSIGGIIQRKHVNTGLYLLNYALLVDAIGVVVIGTFVWWFTLKEMNNFHSLWLAESVDNRIALQDKVVLSCLMWRFVDSRRSV